ncbi:hypothetical protein [Pollutimonas harenae]|uniref:Uncharacterized protein n=1 Tax=Pollutimonas harenae TaxID=657015 RepID=A0A853H072_9BURK|nr:hypothetical protein [Pollutimonas harenae]NYT85430.1 hypothetical protein [Pollutimonas harenae]TEA70524.1 hypothetical protein ERD84_07495 [Pollutimonas harenae]
MNIQSFVWTIDLNGNGAYSAWELWEAAKWVYRIPGNLLLEGLGHVPYLSSLLHIHASEATGYASLNGGMASLLSLVIWVAAIFSVLTLSSPTVYEDDSTLDSGQSLIGMSTAANRQIAGPQKDQDFSADHHAHRPVSRANYAIPGTKPIRHKRHRRLIIT